MVAIEWIVVGAIVAASAIYSVWRLLPKRPKPGAGACSGCSSASAESRTQKSGALPR